MCVKSDEPTRPGSCFWLKNTSLAGPCLARHCRTRRSTVRRDRCQSWPGYSRSSHSTSVLACSFGSRCNCSSRPAHTSSSGSRRVRHVCGLGSVLDPSRYFRAVLRSMPAFIAAYFSDVLSSNWYRNSLICNAVTLRPAPMATPFSEGVASVRVSHTLRVFRHPVGNVIVAHPIRNCRGEG